MQPPGALLVLEGIDGSGKTGVARFLKDALLKRGFAVIGTQEPGGTEEGAALRKMLLARDGYDWTPTSELLLLNAARRQHVDRVVLPAVASGKIVVCDRFVGSTLAYQGAGRGLPESLILRLHELAIGDVWPNLTVVLDLDPEVALRRSVARLAASNVDEGRFEALDLAFHRRVRQSFLAQASERRQSYRVIDASRPADVVQDEALTCVLEYLAGRKPPV